MAKPNPRFHSLGTRLASLPLELQLQIISDLTLSRILELTASHPSLVPTVHAHPGWTRFFTTVRPPPPEPDHGYYVEQPSDSDFSRKYKREARERRQREVDRHDNFVPHSVLPELLEVYPTYLELVTLATARKPPHVRNHVLQLLDAGKMSVGEARGTNMAGVGIYEERYWEFNSLLRGPNYTGTRTYVSGRSYAEQAAEWERQNPEPVANTSVVPVFGLAEGMVEYLYNEVRYYLFMGYEMFLPLLARFTDDGVVLPTTLTVLGSDPPNSELVGVARALRAAERRLNGVKAGQLRRLAEVVERYPPGWVIPLHRPHTRPFPPSKRFYEHLAAKYRTFADRLEDETKSYMLAGTTIADHVFGSDRYPLVPHDLLLEGLIEVLKQHPPSQDAKVWTAQEKETIAFLIKGLGYVKRHDILPARPPAPFDPHGNIYSPIEALVPEEEPPVRTLGTPFSPPLEDKDKETEKEKGNDEETDKAAEKPHFHPPTYLQPNLSPFRHSRAKNLHERKVRFNLMWYRSRAFRKSTPREKWIGAPKGEDRWGGPGRLSGTVMPLEEDEQKWLEGFLQICEAVKGFKGKGVVIKTEKGEEVDVAVWWQERVEGGIERGEGTWERAPRVVRRKYGQSRADYTPVMRRGHPDDEQDEEEEDEWEDLPGEAVDRIEVYREAN